LGPGRARLPPSHHRWSGRDHPDWSSELLFPRRSLSRRRKLLGSRRPVSSLKLFFPRRWLLWRLRFSGNHRRLAVVARREPRPPMLALASMQTLPQQHARQQTFGVRGDVVESQFAFSLGSPPAAESDQPAEVGVRGPVARPQADRRRIERRDLGPDDQRQPDFFRDRMGPNDSRQRVAIGHRQRAIAQFGRPHDQFVRVRGSFEEGEIRAAMQLGIAGFFRGGGPTDRPALMQLGCRLLGHTGNSKRLYTFRNSGSADIFAVDAPTSVIDSRHCREGGGPVERGGQIPREARLSGVSNVARPGVPPHAFAEENSARDAGLAPPPASLLPRRRAQLQCRSTRRRK
jgi:hypothetical protein